MSYLTLEHVGKQYHSGDITVDALKDVSFSLENGEFAVVLGSSGAGKTTLLNLLGGMDKATCGTIDLDGKNLPNRIAQEIPVAVGGAAGVCHADGRMCHEK